MRTVKVVVIGASGVGKTSLRNQYVSGRFTTGYRATIGADFITKTLPHYSSEETVTLQIWDTAGQERFSSLSSAFFRGADAAVLMFDVNQPETLHALTKWWADFREKAPVPDDEAEDFCCVVVGNKVDLLEMAAEGQPRVTEAEAQQFTYELIPISSPVSSPSPALTSIADVQYIPENDIIDDPTESHDIFISPLSHTEHSRTKSIDIIARHTHGSVSASRSRSRSTLFRGGTVGTMTTTHTIYHTPSSSVFDLFDTAFSSPARTAASISIISPPRSPSLPSSRSRSPSHAPRRQASASSVSSAPTITPSFFMRGQTATPSTPTIMMSPSHSFHTPPPPERRPKLFFTSAKTGVGVSDVFEYVARRVVMRREYEEALDARTLHMQESDDAIRLTHRNTDRQRLMGSCCGS
ncbi:ras-domain-containing protein [Laetiporus sulphureus 93-53]|uniref:Ras-domain-containing protein n=1 Tax=Laetiporus sulphureus 93-53 TaxID=1314785 RepID=A0A165FE96_9APHY|nr:ras-domain-containing protein [Laetiporus sulphureus 93-53]KZT08837.1 ras-domain-containing protein [Laetiporus sulphureus 93-53]